MLLTLTTTHQPATDLGFLLAKHPDRCQAFALKHGTAHVFYPEATEARCTAALLLELDPIGLVRRRGDAASLAQYVSDRPYVASSFLSVAIAKVLGTALRGTPKTRPELAELPIPLTATVSAVPCRGGVAFLRRLFEPLGYEVEAERVPLDEEFPEWGASPYHRVRLQQTLRLRELLSHLYVLLPVLDDQKHYWVGRDELEKLLAHGAGWLAEHPERDEIARRYLKHQRRLAREAITRLHAEVDPDPDGADDVKESEEAALERTLTLNEQRMETVLGALRELGATSVIDLGCGEGRLLQHLLRDKAFTRIAGVDVSPRCLEHAAGRLRLDEIPPRQRERIQLFQGSLTYRDQRFAGFDAACAIEVIEHIDESRLGAFERVLFEFARPGHAIITTPNVEYNRLFESLPAETLRHRDHRFEWTRAEFEAWSRGVAARHGYSVRFAPIGRVDASVGAPTQMGVFTRCN